MFQCQNDGPSWTVPTGRRDGRVSSSSQTSSLPSPLESIAVQRQKFAAKGLDDHDLVTLVGIHIYFYIHVYINNNNNTPSPSKIPMVQSHVMFTWQGHIP